MPRVADQLTVFPVFMKVANRFALVVGNGEEALAKARLLKESCARVRLVAPMPSRELGAFVIQADLDHVARPFEPDMVEGAVLVFAATGNRGEDEAINRAARLRNVPVNAVDRPELCDFFTPALVNRAPVAVAIGSEGAGPVLTQLIRSRIEGLLPRGTGELARLAARYRRVVERLVPRGAPRRQFWRAFFEGEVAERVEGGRLAEAARAATRLMRAPSDASGFVSFVGADRQAADLMTLRGQRLLLAADVIVHDGTIGEAVLSLGRRDARRIALPNAEDFAGNAAILAAEAKAGRQVVRLAAAGSDLSAEEAALADAGIAFRAVPGVTADISSSSSRAQAA